MSSFRHFIDVAANSLSQAFKALAGLQTKREHLNCTTVGVGFSLPVCSSFILFSFLSDRRSVP